jgi:DNA-binding IclR family transcriptional regulator
MIDELFVALCELGGSGSNSAIKAKATEMFPGIFINPSTVSSYLQRLGRQGWLEQVEKGSWRATDLSLRNVAENRINDDRRTIR